MHDAVVGGRGGIGGRRYRAPRHQEKVEETEVGDGKEEITLLDSLIALGYTEVFDDGLCKEGKALVLRQDLRTAYDVEEKPSEPNPNS